MVEVWAGSTRMGSGNLHYRRSAVFLFVGAMAFFTFLQHLRMHRISPWQWSENLLLVSTAHVETTTSTSTRNTTAKSRALVPRMQENNTTKLVSPRKMDSEEDVDLDSITDDDEGTKKKMPQKREKQKTTKHSAKTARDRKAYRGHHYRPGAHESPLLREVLQEEKKRKKTATIRTRTTVLA
jgi:hypothetical protein